jgi:hypothetical protein
MERACQYLEAVNPRARSRGNDRSPDGQADRACGHRVRRAADRRADNCDDLNVFHIPMSLEVTTDQLAGTAISAASKTTESVFAPRVVAANVAVNHPNVIRTAPMTDRATRRMAWRLRRDDEEEFGRPHRRHRFGGPVWSQD